MNWYDCYESDMFVEISECGWRGTGFADEADRDILTCDNKPQADFSECEGDFADELYN